MNTRSEILLPCNCGVHVGSVVFYASEEGFSDSVDSFFFTYGTRYEGYSRDTFWTRLKTAWHILRKGEYDFNEVVLVKDDVVKLRDFLNSVIDEREEENPDELVEAVVRQEGNEEDFPGADSDVFDSAEPE